MFRGKPRELLLYHIKLMKRWLLLNPQLATLAAESLAEPLLGNLLMLTKRAVERIPGAFFQMYFNLLPEELISYSMIHSSPRAKRCRSSGYRRVLESLVYPYCDDH